MMPEKLQYFTEERKPKRKTPDEKLITTVQICLFCERKFPFKRGRKRCPFCQSLLRNKILILKAPRV